MEIKNKRLDDIEFQKERKKVLAEWPTGREVDIEEAVEFHKSLAPSKNAPMRILEAKEKGEILPWVGGGLLLLDQHVELLKYAQDVGGAKFLSTHVDSSTRRHDFEGVERWIKESVKTGKSQLNGVPVVNYGVAAVRKIIQAIDVPMRLAVGAPDLRIIWEIGIAGGFSEGGRDALSAFGDFTGRVTLETALRNQQYVWRLFGLYQEKGVPIYFMPSSFGETSVAVAGAVTQALIAAEQGVKYMGPNYELVGSLVQDVACTSTLLKLCREYLDRFGYSDVQIWSETGYSLPMPTDTSKAYAVIGFNCLIGWLTGATVVGFKTVAEGKMICSKEELAESHKCANAFLNLIKDQKVKLDKETLNTESSFIEMEARLILDRIYDLGEGDWAVGIVRAVEAGVIDASFSANRAVHRKVLTARDNECALRWLDCGDLPFTKEIMGFHKGKLAERKNKLGQEVDFDIIAADITAMSEGFLKKA